MANEVQDVVFPAGAGAGPNPNSDLDLDEPAGAINQQGGSVIL